MSFCPNKSLKSWKDLEASQGSKMAHYLWDRYKGNVPAMYYVKNVKQAEVDNTQQAKSWLAERFGEDAVNIFETAQSIGSETVHGYVQNASVYLWSAAEIGAEYHEAYHLVFRTMLSDSQRQGLYEEAAATYGEPTSEEIAYVRKAFPNISDQEARLTALEEKMSEQFREYVLTEKANESSIPGKIAKFFRDLWNFIKAMFSDSVGLKQVYSLIDSNTMNSSIFGRGVFRNAEKFKGTNKAYMYRPEMGDRLFNDTMDTLYTLFMEEKKKYGKDLRVSDVLGKDGGNGSIVNGLIEQMYESTDPNKQLSLQDAKELFKAELEFDNAKGEAKKEAYNKVLGLLEAKNASFAMHDRVMIRNVFKNVGSTWYDTLDPVTGNITRTGWRTFLEIKLREAALIINNSREKYSSEIESDDITEGNIEDMGEEFMHLEESVTKIYGKSSLQESPSKRLTGRLKEMLSSIKATTPNSLGYVTYIPRDRVYKEMLKIVAGKTSFEEIKAELAKAAKLKPHLRNVMRFVNKLKGQEAALFYSGFALINTEFVMLRSRTVGEVLHVDVINPNRKDAITNTVDKWKLNLTTREEENPRALYREVPKLDSNNNPVLEEGEQVYHLVPIKEKLVKAQQLMRNLENLVLKSRSKEAIPVATEDGSISEITASIAELMWLLGMNIGDNVNISDTQLAIQNIINNGTTILDPSNKYVELKGGQLANSLVYNLSRLLKLVGNFGQKDGSAFGFLDVVTPKPDYISLNRNLTTSIAELFGPLLSSVGESYVSANGQSTYPINLATHMSDIVNVLRNGGEAGNAALTEYLQDPFINGGSNEHMSILFKYLKQSPEFRRQFNTQDFDAAKGLSEFEEALMYEDFSKSDVLVTTINAFINGNSNSPTCLIAIPTQSDRNKYTFIVVPRVLSGAFGIKSTESTLIKSQIIQDLLRIAKAKKVVEDAQISGDYSNLIEGVHTAPGDSSAIIDKTSKKYYGTAFSDKSLQFTATNDAGLQIVTDAVIGKDTLNPNGVVQLSDEIEKYVKGELNAAEKSLIDSKINNMVNEMSIYIGKQADAIYNTLKKDGKLGEIGIGNISASSDPEAGKNIYRGFVVTNMIMRNEIVKLFRGSRANNKNLEDFYKRMGHLTTPGVKMAMKGEVGSESWLNGEEYGMMPNFTETTFYDPKLNITPALEEQAHMTANNIANGLVRNVLRNAGLNTNVAIEYSSSEQVVRVDNGVTILNSRLADSEEMDVALERLFPQVKDLVAKSVGIGNEYRPGRFDGNDGQAYISLDMHRSIQQGLGQWEQEDEEAYKAYQTTGEFVYQEGFVPKDFKVGDAVPIKPYKPYFEDLFYNQATGAMNVVSEKNHYSVVIRSYAKNHPQLSDLLDRMEGRGAYAGMDKIHVVNFGSGKKMGKRGMHKITGQPGEYANISYNSNRSSKLRFPQTIPSMKSSQTVTFNRQIKKNMISNVKDITTYTYNAGLASEFNIDGRNMKITYHRAIEEKLKRDLEAAEKELSIDKLREAAVLREDNPQNYNKLKLEILKNVREILMAQIQDGNLTSNYSNALDIVFTPTGEPRFSIPIDLPIFNKKYESILLSIFNNQVFKQKLKGFEAVQVAELGGHSTDNALNFLQISEDGRRVIHADVMIREDVARRFGIEPGQSLDAVPEELRRIIGYRIPNADKGATVILKIAKVLPNNYEKAVVIPGQLIKLMGSDFDVDKLNLLFPEVEEDLNSPFGVRKVNVDYAAIMQNPDIMSDPNIVSNKMLNNIITDTIEAVYANPAHLFEVFTPLDDVTLSDEAERIAKAIPELAAASDWNSWETEADTIVKNIRGNKLRGIYANIIAGRNVAMHGVIHVNKDYAIKIQEDDGNVTEYIEYLSEFDGVTTDKTGALFLSAAVDASKTPVQKELNDSVLTSRIRAMFLAFYPEYDSSTCTNFLNQPIIRELTTLFETKYSGNLTKFNKAYKAIFKLYKVDTLLPAENPNYTIPMKRSEINNLSSENRDKVQQAIMLHNFNMLYNAGRSLLSLYKRITPDSMDGMNRIGGIQSYNDKAAEYDVTLEDDNVPINNTTIFFGADKTVNVVDQFIGENSIYGLERGYENLKNSIMENSGIFFPSRTSPAFMAFKEKLKLNTSKNQFTAEMHQLIDYNLMFMMLMKPESPFFRNVSYTDLYKDPKNNIYTRLVELKKKYLGLGAAKFLSGFESDFLPESNYYGLKLDTSTAGERSEKEQFINGLRAMLFNPIVFISAPNSEKVVGPDGKYSPEMEGKIKEIKKLGRDLLMHTFLTNGFRQSSDSYSDMLPEDFFTTPMDVDGKKISIADFFYAEREKLNDATYFSGADLVNYMTMFGKMRAGGSGLLNSASSSSLNQNLPPLAFSDHHEKYIVVKNKATKATAVYQKTVFSEGKSHYVGLKGSYAAKGAHKLYGSGIAWVLKNPNNVNIETSAIYTPDMDKSRASNLDETGTVSCSL